MNYYEKELLRLERNFNFSLGIYSRNRQLQRTLCVQMMKKVNALFIPRSFWFLKLSQDKLYQRIQTVYLQL